MTAITSADIAAALDVVNQLAAEADSLTVQQAIELRAAVDALQKGAKFAHEMLTTSALNQIEKQPVQIGSTIWAAEDDGKWRLNHAALRRLIERDALHCGINPTTGEINAEQAVHRAMELMTRAFVSPASFPKQTVLEELGIDNKSVGHFERTKKVLKEHAVKVVDDE